MCNFTGRSSQGLAIGIAIGVALGVAVGIAMGAGFTRRKDKDA
jgi:ABC-type nitrate/sulfonate/bicarbonate transport system permease component